MIEQIDQWDKSLLLWLNSLHFTWLDHVMLMASHKFFWLPLYLGLVIWLIWQEKWQTLYLLVAIALVVTLADRFTSGLMKPFFERPRPCHDPEIGHLVRLIGSCGGKFGFASSHAANVFGLASFFWVLWGKKYKVMALLFPWAVLVSYSRVYLGVHYPTDITVGALVGIISGWLVCYLWLWAQYKLPPASMLLSRIKKKEKIGNESAWRFLSYKRKKFSMLNT